MIRTEDGAASKCEPADVPGHEAGGYRDFPGLVIQSNTEFSRELAALSGPLQMCTSCAQCESACPSRLPITDAIMRLRARFGTSTEGGERMLRNVRQHGRTVAPVSRSMAPTEGSALFFPGCIGEARTPLSVQMTLDLLLAVGDGMPPRTMALLRLRCRSQRKMRRTGFETSTPPYWKVPRK